MKEHYSKQEKLFTGVIYFSPSGNPKLSDSPSLERAEVNEEIPSREEARNEVIQASRRQREGLGREVETQRSLAEVQNDSETDEDNDVVDSNESSAESNNVQKEQIDGTQSTFMENTEKSKSKSNIMNVIMKLIGNIQILFAKFQNGEISISDIPKLLNEGELNRILGEEASGGDFLEQLKEACKYDFSIDKIDLNASSISGLLGSNVELSSDELIGLLLKQQNPSVFVSPQNSFESLRKGDLIFFKNPNGSNESKTEEVAIVLDNGEGGLKVKRVGGINVGNEINMNEGNIRDTIFGFVKLSDTLRATITEENSV